MEPLNQLHQALKKQMMTEISSLREGLSLEHQLEYAILSGDQQMQASLHQYLSESYVNQSKAHQKRQEITAKILKLSVQASIDLPSLMLSLDDDGCESGALFEQLELLQTKINNQKTRNSALLLALDVEKALPTDQIHIQTVYAVNRQKPLLVTVDYDDPSLKKS